MSFLIKKRNLLNKMYYFKSLKKFKGQSEAANQRWTDSVMAKRKGTSNDLKNTTQKTKCRTTRTPPKQNGN
jgi:hypothetical protein